MRWLQGFDITPDLRRMCSSLTLQQIYKLTEHHHDDWITGSQTTDTIVLLQTLKRVVDSTVRLCSPLCILSLSFLTPCAHMAMPTAFCTACRSNSHALWLPL